MADGVENLRRLLAEERLPWYIVAPPWNEGAPWINAGSPDPHALDFVCDLVNHAGEDGPEEARRVEERAALIVLLVNAADEIAALIEAAKAVSDCEDLQNDKITPAVDEALSRQDEALAAVERKLAQP